MNKEFNRIQDLTTEELADPKIFDAASRRAYSQGEIQHLLKHSPIEFLRPIIESMVEGEVVSIDDIPKVFLEDYEIAAIYVKQDSSNMVMLPESFKDDADFINEAACYDGEVLRHATDRVKNIEKVLNTALKNSQKALKYVPDQLKTKERCIAALTGNFPDYSVNWQYVPKPLCLDENFIKEVGVFCPKIYQYLDASIKDKYDITEYFLNREGSNLKYASEEHKNNAELVAAVLKKHPVYLRFAGDKLKNDPKFILPIIESAPYELFECGESIKSSFEVARSICNVKSHQSLIGFFNEEIKSDITVAMISVLRTPESMNYISKTLSSDVDFVSLCLEQERFNITSLHYISNDLKNNVDIMVKAYDRSPDCLEYVGNDLKHNSKFLTHIFSTTNNGKPVPPKLLISNLRKLNLTAGCECALLHFYDNSRFKVDDENTKEVILNQITDKKFSSILRKQVDLYEYLKSATLAAELQKDLNKPEIKSQERKIKV